MKKQCDPKPIIPRATGDELIFFRETEQLDRYMELSKQIADRSPNDWIALFQYAYSCKINQRYEESRTIFHKILLLNINDTDYMKSETYRFIGDTYREQKNHIAASDNYRLAIETIQTETPPPGRNPEVNMHLSLCESCYFAGDTDGSLEAVNNAMSLGAITPTVYRTKALILQSMKRYEESMECSTVAIQLDPNNSVHYQNRGDAFYDLGKHEQAVTDYDVAIELSPIAYLYAKKARSLIELKGYDSALSTLEICLSMFPDYVEGYYAKIDILETLGRYEESNAVYDIVIKYQPDNSTLWNNKGANLNTMERYEEAIEMLDRSIELEPSLPNSYCHKGYACYKLGRYNDALKLYNMALEIDPAYVLAKERKETLLSKFRSKDGK